MANKNWRTKQYSVRLNRRRVLFIKIRKFRTASKNRTKKHKQFVVSVAYSPIKEVSLSIKNTRIQKRGGLGKNKDQITLQKLTTYSLIIIGIVSTIFFSFKVSASYEKVAEPDVFSINIPSAHIKNEEQITYPESIPMQISIPTIKLNTSIKQVGKLPDGTMETPGYYENLAGWYKYGPTPGEKGPAVIVGHVGNKQGPSVFWNLGKLKARDVIEITREDKTVVKFSVTALKQFDKENFPTNEIYGDIYYEGLRLITCGGVFNKLSGDYPKNTVVFATLIN